MPYSGNCCVIEKNETITGINEDDVKKTLDDSEVLLYLNTPVELENGVTLLNVMNSVAKLPLLKLFVSHYSCCLAIDEFHKQAKTDIIENKTNSRLVVQGKLSIGSDKKPHASIYYDWFMKTPYKLDEENFYDKNNCDKCKDDVEHDHVYSVSYENANKLANMPIVIESTCEIPYNYAFLNKLIRKEIKEIKINPTLLEFLDAIYDEISFHGTPEETTSVKLELTEMLKEIEELK